MTALRSILATALFFLTFWPSVLRACSCVMVSSGCSRGSNSSEGVIFLGKVIAKVDLTTPDDAGAPNLYLGYAVNFSVSESFNGVSEAETVVYTGRGGGDCGYPFVVGTSYLVYAGAGSDGRLSTGICTGTQPEIMVGGLLKQLRAIRDAGHGFDLVGTVFVLPKGAGYADQVESQPLEGVPVRAIGSHGGLFSTVTDSHGAYSFDWLPPDTYKLQEALPAGLALAQGVAPRSFVIIAADKQVSNFGCLLDVSVRPDCQISGTVVDATGARMPGFVTLEPADPKEAAAARQRGGLPGDETEDGKFSLPHLPPGRYRLVFVPKIGGHMNFRQKFYWPPSNAANSSAIEISLGQHIDDVRFEIPLSASEQLAPP